MSADITEQLGGEAISPEDVPDGVIPMEFDSVEEAREFIERQNELLSSNVSKEYNLASTSGGILMDSSRTGVKKQTFIIGLGKINVEAKFACTRKKFTKVISVKSVLTGLSYGNEWVQDTYSSAITNKGRKLTVKVYGHLDYYILVNSKSWIVKSAL